MSATASILQAYRELQKKFVADRKREEACSGEFGLYYENRLDPENEDDDEPDFVKHRAPQHRWKNGPIHLHEAIDI